MANKFIIHKMQTSFNMGDKNPLEITYTEDSETLEINSTSSHCEEEITIHVDHLDDIISFLSDINKLAKEGRL